MGRRAELACWARVALGLGPLDSLHTEKLFSGRIESAALDNAVLSKTGVTPHFLGLSLRMPNPKVPALLVAQVSGSSRLEQHGRSCTLRPGDWCLIDMLHPFATRSLEERNEHLNLTLERPSDPERLTWRDADSH
jgi:AraC-like protein